MRAQASCSSSVEAAQENARKTIPAARLGTVEELASTAVFLCSRQAAYINGTEWFVRTLVWRGLIGSAIIGKRHVIDRLDLDAYMHKAKALANV